MFVTREQDHVSLYLPKIFGEGKKYSSVHAANVCKHERWKWECEKGGTNDQMNANVVARSFTHLENSFLKCNDFGAFKENKKQHIMTYSKITIIKSANTRRGGNSLHQSSSDD